MFLENQHISFNNNKVTINNDSIYLLIGQIHNDILNELVSPTPATFSTPFPPIKNDVDFIPANKQPQVLFKNSYGLTVYSNSNIEDLTKKVIIEDNTSFTNNSNYLEALSSYKDKGDITELQCNILSLFYEAFNESAENPTDMDNIANYYIYTTNKSRELNNEEKQQLQICFAIAKYSFRFWYEKGIYK